MTRRTAILFILFVTQILSVKCQLSKLTFQFKHISSGQLLADTAQMLLDDTNINKIQNDICYGGYGHHIVIRISPSRGNIDLISKYNGLTDNTRGVRPCMPGTPPVDCTCNMCQEFCQCRVNVQVSCELDHDLASFETTQRIDVTLENVDSKMTMTFCYEQCALGNDAPIKLPDSEYKGMSSLGIGFIVAGAMVFAGLVVIGAVILKIKKYRLIERRLNECHTISCAR